MDGIINCPHQPNQLEIPDVCLGALLFDGIRNYSTTAVIDVATGREVSRQEFLQKSESLARNLIAMGCRRGDVIGMFAPNSVEFALVAAATFRVEAKMAGFNCLLTADEVIHQLSICRPKFLFTDEPHLKVIQEVIKKDASNSAMKLIVKGSGQGYVRLDSLFTDPPGHVILPTLYDYRPKPDDVCCLMFSSGTTGLQKAVALSHRNAIFACILLSHPLIQMTANKSLVFTPLSHITALNSTLACLMSGYTVHIMAKFDFEQYLQALSKYKINSIFVVPPIATLLAKNALVDKYRIHLTDLQCGASTLGPEVEHLLRQRFPGLNLRQFYGMTETFGGFIGVPTYAKVSAKPGSVGVPVFNSQVKVVDPATGKILGRNATGEICVKAPINMIGYINNAKATAETIDQDGWLHTGDLGHYDEDGYFFITDRIKELIKYNAYQVAPAELEAVLLSHPDVADAAVIGLPDLAAGELPMACVVRQPSSTVSEKDIMSFVEGKVAPYKKLRGGVKFVTVIPKTPSGKILRRVIKKGLIEGKL